MQFKNHNEFFEYTGDYHIKAITYGVDCSFEVEEMYQHFKARLLEELAATSLKLHEADEEFSPR